jgi:SET domain-containing protein
MLCVPTEVRPSKIHGTGVFLLKPVKKGALIWCFDSRVDRVYTLAEIETLPPHMEKFFLKYGYWHEETNVFVMHGDNGRYINHAVKPNLLSAGSAFGDLTAVQNLAAGAEITVDYRKHCDYVRLTGKFS